MYIIIEGMPCSGKTTFANKLSQKYRGIYFKSVLSNDNYGDKIRLLRETYDTEMIDLLHIVDLLRNEIQINHLLSNGETVIRDKCFASSFAHFLATHENETSNDSDIILCSYKTVAELSILPDIIVTIDRDYQDTIKAFKSKADKSKIDESIIEDVQRFQKQKEYLFKCVTKYFQSCIVCYLHISSDYDFEDAEKRIDDILKSENCSICSE